MWRMLLIFMVSKLSLASASELTHRFEDPSLGGNPLNGSFLLNQANEQNNFQDPDAGKPSGYKPPSPIERFKQSLQSAILNQVSRASMGDLFDANGNIQPGKALTFDLDGDGSNEFSITVGAIDEATGNVTISIFDGISETLLTVPAASSL